MSNSIPAPIVEVIDSFFIKTPLEEAIKKTKQESRRYAKRQMTWFKNSFISDLLPSNLYIDNDELVDNAIKAFNLLSNKKC